MNDDVHVCCTQQNEFVRDRMRHWDMVAERETSARLMSGYYHDCLRSIFRNLVMPGQAVLELGCGKGDLLAALEPCRGVGIDFSEVMIRHARKKYPDLEFVCAEVSRVELAGRFDIIVMSDLVNDVWDVQAILRQVRGWCHPGTRVLLNTFNRVWQVPMNLARRLGLARRILPENWLTPEDIVNLLELEGFDLIRRRTEVLCPTRIPLVSALMNRYLAKLFPFRHLAMTNVFVARPLGIEVGREPEPRVSIVVAARNEEGNIKAIFDRMPELGAGIEVIFVEGGSNDDTYGAIKQELKARNKPEWKLLRQDGKGKGDAVRKGFAAATGEILMILDADLTVRPADLEKFYQALVAGRGEFINGVRLVYPMHRRAMRFCNLLGNKFFSLAFSWILEQSIKDTLCGTKVLWRKDYERIAANRSYFGDFDPFGDFDLIFGAARLNLKIVDMPVRYGERVYGDTNISRWKHGWLLLRMVMFAARRIKFV